MKYRLLLGCWLMLLSVFSVQATNVVIGLNYPATGPHSIEGIAQLQATQLAIEEINASGGILGKTIKLVAMDSQSKVEQSKKNVEIMADKYGAKILLGGVTSSATIVAGKIAKSRNRLYFATLTHGDAITGKAGHSHIFSANHTGTMTARVLAKYLNQQHSKHKYAFITGDLNEEIRMEQLIRTMLKLEDTEQHKSIMLSPQQATEIDYKKALNMAQTAKPQVLVIALSGQAMTAALGLVAQMKLKQDMTVVVPHMTLGLAKVIGAYAMEGVISTVSWTWKIPFQQQHKPGMRFVNRFVAKYRSYPSTSSAQAYTIVYQYRDAVERAKSFDTQKVISALESHQFVLLKGSQLWRGFDHQNVQTVFAVKGKPVEQVNKDKYHADYFEIITSMAGTEAAIDKAEWDARRQKSGASAYLQ